MDYVKLTAINNKLKAASQPFQKGGKIYVEVCKRLQGFWELYPNGRIITDFTELTADHAVCRAYVFDGDIQLVTGTAREEKGAGFINKTSYVENAETSAIGRALGNLGIGSVDAIASYDEVQMAEQPKAPATKKKTTAKTKTTVRKQFVEICMEYGLNAGAMARDFKLNNDSSDEEFQTAIDSVKKMMEGA